MEINPTDEVANPLAEMFRMQEALNARCAPECDKVVKTMKDPKFSSGSSAGDIASAVEDMTPESRQQVAEWMLNFIRATQQELGELTDSIPWKWWAKYQEFDLQNARVEIVDIFHFVISLAQVAGMSAEDVYTIYRQKNLVNHNRQDSGYVTKDEEDSRHIGGIQD